MHGICLLPILLLWGCTGPEQASNPQDIMNRPEVQRVLFRPRAAARTALPPGAADVDVEAEPGITIGCRLFTADKAAPTILFFHGNGEIVADYDEIGPLYMEAGLNFLVVDYRGYGWSGGSPSFANLLADSHVLYNQLQQHLQTNGYVPALFLMGRSLGSAAAIELAAEHDAEISGLIIESGFALTLPLAETLGLGGMLENFAVTEEQTFNNAGKISRVTKPTFLLHGQKDSLIPLWQAEKLHAASGARNKELQIVPGAEHNSLIAVGGKHYFQAVSRFVRQVTGADDWRRRRKQFKEAQQAQ